MPPSPDKSVAPEAGAGVFATTHWSMVVAAGDSTSPESVAALEKLGRTYSHPLSAHVRRRGQDHHSAEDLTQGFFARLLDQQWLNSVAREKGRFRTFLLAALDHFLANEWRRGQTLKRGGGRAIV